MEINQSAYVEALKLLLEGVNKLSNCTAEAEEEKVENHSAMLEQFLDWLHTAESNLNNLVLTRTNYDDLIRATYRDSLFNVMELVEQEIRSIHGVHA